MARPTAAWWLWMGGQLITLAITAGRLPVASHFSIPIDDAALTAVAVVQILLMLMLAPALLPDHFTAASTFAGGLIMLTAGAQLSGQPVSAMVPVACWLGLWLAALTGPRARWIRPLLLVLSVGGIAAFYAAAEAGESTRLAWVTLFCPLLGAPPISSHANAGATAYALPSVILVAKMLSKKHLRIG